MTDENFFAQVGAGLTTPQPEIFTPAEGAKRCGCHPNSVKRLADELGIVPRRTANGLRIFNLEQIEKIAAELVRRRKEALR